MKRYLLLNCRKKRRENQNAETAVSYGPYAGGSSTNWLNSSCLPLLFCSLTALLAVFSFTCLTMDAHAISLATQHHHSSSLPLKTYQMFRPDKQMTISVVKAGRTRGPIGNYNQIYAVTFHAFGREFRLHVTPSTSNGGMPPVFVHHHGQTVDPPVRVDADEIASAHFIGYVAEHESNTDVVVSISNSSRSKSSSPHLNEFSRVFATIYTADEHYYIEPLHTTGRECAELRESDINLACLAKADFVEHIIYRASDVKLSSPTTNDVTTSNELFDQKLSRDNKYCDYVTGPDKIEYENVSATFARTRRSAVESEIEQESAELRSYRSGYEPLNKDCPLLLVADYRFYRTIGGNDTSQTVNYLINIIERINILYRRTDFATSKTEHMRDMGFSIRGIIVHTSPEEKGVSSTAAASSDDKNSPSLRDNDDALHYNMPNRRWKVKQLLEAFSRESIHKYYCLSHLFTDQIFEDGILGLAYVASRHKLGGICSGEDGHVRASDGKRLYLNTGLSSIRNEYGRQIITRQAELVLAHELAHNWGAQHDPDLPECSPASRVGGKYLMHTYSVSGLNPNNRFFSPCSRNAIAQVLRERAEKCFVSRFDSFCGNSIVERYVGADGEEDGEGEECDGGLNKQQDKCCNELCRLRPGAQCSDRNDMCCADCKLVPRSARLICARGNVDTCTADSYCTGTSAECPPARPLADGTTCLNGGKCLNGTCISYCESLQPPQRSCQCDSVQYACLMCCQLYAAPGSDNRTIECRPAQAAMPLPDGTPCMRGYCRNAQCERVVQSATLARWWIIIGQRYPHSLFKRILTDNLVMLVIFATLAVWLPIAITIARYDAKKRAQIRKTKVQSPLYVHPSYSTNSNLGQGNRPLLLNSKSIMDSVQEEDEAINEYNAQRDFGDRVFYDNGSQRVNLVNGRRRTNTEPAAAGKVSRPTEIF